MTKNANETIGVIVFGSDQEVAGVMRAVQRADATRTFSWVGSDGWSARALVCDGNEPAVEGTISVQPQANEVKGFREYFLGLNVHNNKRNPWFVEFWEDHFSCRLPGSARTPYNAGLTRACSGDERLSADNTEFEAQLQFVSDAVMAFAYAIRDMHAAVCGAPGLCDAMRPASGAELLRYLRRVNFTGLTGDEFHFDSNGDGPARYNILHFKQTVCSYRCPSRTAGLTGDEFHFDGNGDGPARYNILHFKQTVCSYSCPSRTAGLTGDEFHFDSNGDGPALYNILHFKQTVCSYSCPSRTAGLTGDEFHFDSNGDGPARYNILHFKQTVCSYSCPSRTAGLTGDKFHFDSNGDGPARYNILHFKQTVCSYSCPSRTAGLTGDEFHFDSNGDGPARYNILHFKQVSPGVFRWLRVGRYLDGELQLDLDGEKQQHLNIYVPTSRTRWRGMPWGF
ncbi:hypothetical protein JYU34_006225 [Plutella xylostella]|uniref:Receptor ligand binding region domain-containing protein n=1 Tax=Plutella xylostella TaxID=51655 RepID=A0ABQ7QV73_PLUXY|nr:hypothetical protein JYU34_006225 [Plutella xylostella]